MQVFCAKFGIVSTIRVYNAVIGFVVLLGYMSCSSEKKNAIAWYQILRCAMFVFSFLKITFLRDEMHSELLWGLDFTPL